VRGYNPGIQVTTCLSDEDAALRALLHDVDVLLVTPSASVRVRSLEPRAPIIEVSFKPDERSVQQLGALIGTTLGVPALPLPARCHTATGRHAPARAGSRAGLSHYF